jgi:hypothetical protein
MERFLNSELGILILTLGVSKPIIADNELIAVGVGQDKAFAKIGFSHTILIELTLKSKPYRSITSFSIDRENLHALLLVPHVCEVSIKSK